MKRFCKLAAGLLCSLVPRCGPIGTNPVMRDYVIYRSIFYGLYFRFYLVGLSAYVLLFMPWGADGPPDPPPDSGGSRPPVPPGWGVAALQIRRGGGLSDLRDYVIYRSIFYGLHFRFYLVGLSAYVLLFMPWGADGPPDPPPDSGGSRPPVPPGWGVAAPQIRRGGGLSEHLPSPTPCPKPPASVAASAAICCSMPAEDGSIFGRR
jgi:hypothetical protein